MQTKYQITEQSIINQIEKEEYAIMGRKTVVCLLKLKNGFEVVGSSSCVDPNNFIFEVGKKYAYQDAFKKVWQLEGYRLQQHIYDEQTGGFSKDYADYAAQIMAEKLKEALEGIYDNIQR